MNEPVISVIMSVYNGEKFLVDAIESILNQTFRNFEFIIVNDGSTDTSLTIIEKYAKRDCRIRLISRENKGLTVSLNEGIASARGEWIARMDADDISLPDRFKKQIAWLEKTGADICGGGIKLIGTWSNRVRQSYESSNAIALKLLFGSSFAHPTVIFRSSIARKNPYNEKAHYVEDYELWTRFATLGVKMTNCPEVVLQYRIHSQQVTERKQQQQRDNMRYIFKKYSTSFLSSDLSGHPGYLLIADKQLEVDKEGFYKATNFLHNLIKLHGDPEKVISVIAFAFFTRCGLIEGKNVVHEMRSFQLGIFQKMVVLSLVLFKVDPASRFYHFLYKIR